MAVKAPIGGGNLLEVYTYDTSGNATTKLFSFDKVVTTAIAGHPKKGRSFTIDIDQKINNEAWETFLDAYIVTEDTELQEQVYEDGSKDTISSAAESAPKFLYVYYEGAVGGKRKVHTGLAYLSGDSGNVSTSANTLTTTPVQLTAYAADKAYTIGTPKLDALKVTATAAISFGTGAYGSRTFISLPS